MTSFFTKKQVVNSLRDHSVKHPLGILEDVPMKVGHFYVLVDFVILNMVEDIHT